jgi:5'-AMP-activated protein kinase catalytic alpha subunit
LKPENLLLDNDNNIKIADFGLSNVAYDGDFLRTSCGSPNYAAPEVISGSLYAGPEVDVWSCGVILYALLCGTLPFDDESIPNLFKKIKSGMYSLPSYLSQPARDLILKMLVADPMNRISIKDIRRHPWFQHKLPIYLSLPPDGTEGAAREIDEEVSQEVMMLNLHGSSPRAILEVVLLSPMEAHQLDKQRSAIRVAYELILDNKRQKQRIEELVMAQRSASAQSSSHGSGSLRITSMAEGSIGEPSSMPNSVTGPVGNSEKQEAYAARQKELSMRRRRWYLGIQSKKDPAQVMTEVYQALLALGCVWHPINNYRVVSRWMYPVVDGSQMETDTGASSGDEVKIALTLYKVQQYIYLLDFQRVEGAPFGFMKLCALIIGELKTLSSRSDESKNPK